MEILSSLITGLGTLASTPLGAGLIVGAIVLIVVKLIQWTPTKVDDQILAKYGPMFFSAAGVIEKAIPNGTQVTALQFIDKTMKSVSESGKVDVSNKKLMTVIKGELIKIAKASTKVDTSEAKMVELKN